MPEPKDVLAGTIPINKLLAELVALKKNDPKQFLAASKTILNYVKKAGRQKDPYWQSAELVPTKTAFDMREINRRALPKYPGQLEEVVQQVSKGITKDFPFGTYNPLTQRVSLGEGNTRVQVAYEAGWPAVPLRIIKSERKPYALPGALAPTPAQPNQFGYTPSNYKPSELGYDTYSLKDLEALLANRKRILGGQ
jgi:hypothetical protein